MQALFGHDGGVEGVTTSYGTRVPPGPSAFAHAQSRATMGFSGLTARRPSLHLRGSLTRADAEQDWSATASHTPADEQSRAAARPEEAAPDLSDPTSPVAAVSMPEVMREVSKTYDLNVQETDHFEWLLSSGPLPTF